MVTSPIDILQLPGECDDNLPIIDVDDFFIGIFVDLVCRLHEDTMNQMLNLEENSAIRSLRVG